MSKKLSEHRLSNTATFAGIARQNDRILRAGIKEMRDGRQGFHLPGMETVYRACLTTIVFAAAALEAYIYDYAARKLSDGFVRNYLERLNLVSKWIVIPKLATGREFPRDGQEFEHLKRLVADRNRVMHSKSRIVDLEELAKEKSPRDMLSDYSSVAENAIAALDGVIEVMDKLDSDERAEEHLGPLSIK